MKQFLICLPLLLLTTADTSVQAQHLNAITGVTIIDGTGREPIKDAVILIEGTRISAVGSRENTKIPRGARLEEMRGKFIIAGLADMHNHLGDGTFSFDEGPSDFKKNLARMLGFGFTTLFDQGIPDLKSFAELKDLAAAETAPFPHFLGVGVRFAARGGHGSALGAYTPETPEEARKNVRELKAARVDGVKIVYDDLSYVTNQPRPMLKSEVVAAIIDEARKQGLKSYVHAPVLKYAKEVLRAGANGLVHGIISEPVDDEFISLMKKNRAVYIATHTVFESVADLGGWARRQAAFDKRGLIPRHIYEEGMNRTTIERWEARWANLSVAKAKLPILRANTKRLEDAGVIVVLGSDTASAGSGTGVLLGLASQVELALLVEAGLTSLQAIQAATINAARMVGREKDLGSVERGKLADLLILDADPLADIANVHQIYRVIKGGVEYHPAKPLSATK
jgi:imidazolonepropionase-like amidohydrolase